MSSVAGLADDLDVCIGEQARDAGAHQHHVVGDDYAHGGSSAWIRVPPSAGALDRESPAGRADAVDVEQADAADGVGSSDPVVGRLDNHCVRATRGGDPYLQAQNEVRDPLGVSPMRRVSRIGNAPDWKSVTQHTIGLTRGVVAIPDIGVVWDEPLSQGHLTKTEARLRARDGLLVAQTCKTAEGGTHANHVAAEFTRSSPERHLEVAHSGGHG